MDRSDAYYKHKARKYKKKYQKLMQNKQIGGNYDGKFNSAKNYNNYKNQLSPTYGGYLKNNDDIMNDDDIISDDEFEDDDIMDGGARFLNLFRQTGGNSEYILKSISTNSNNVVAGNIVEAEKALNKQGITHLYYYNTLNHYSLDNNLTTRVVIPGTERYESTTLKSNDQLFKIIIDGGGNLRVSYLTHSRFSKLGAEINDNIRDKDGNDIAYQSINLDALASGDIVLQFDVQGTNFQIIKN